MQPCPNNGYWDFPELASTCADDDYDKGGSILHEFTHLVSHYPISSCK